MEISSKCIHAIEENVIKIIDCMTNMEVTDSYL